jgi:hypothetical protein
LPRDKLPHNPGKALQQIPEALAARKTVQISKATQIPEQQNPSAPQKNRCLAN